MADSDYSRQSGRSGIDWAEFFKDNDPEQLRGGENTLAFLKEIANEEERITKEKQKQREASKLMQDILREYEDEQIRQAEKEAEYDKKKLKIELEIEKVKKRIQTSDSKHADRELKNLEKHQKLLSKLQKQQEELTKAAEKAQQLRDRYAINERKDLHGQLQEIQHAGWDIFRDGLRNLNFKEIFEGASMGLTGGMSGIGGVVKALDTITVTINSLGKKLDTAIDEIVKYKSDWDTRLFGSGRSYSSIVDAISDSIGASPYVKQADVMKNLDAAIAQGLAYNVEQRAFLQTVSDEIATTFNAFDSTLLQIIRIQRSDSTAARLGMEATLNAYLNNMYQNTEYLQNVSDSVTTALYEATSLLSAQQSIGFEYQAQKWLGSLYSVGMSQSSVSSIADALGKLASGDISATGSGAGKLLVMAASQAGLPYADLLTQGINESDLNKLMKSMVQYLQQIASSNKVVQTQYASIFGLATSDIVAAKNLAQSTIDSISQYGLSYSGALGTLDTMARSIGERMSLGEKMENVTSNFQYSLASNIASNPGLYAMWQISNMLDTYFGGMPIPTVTTMFGGVDLNTTVADLMRTTALGSSVLSGIGTIIGSLGDTMSGQGVAGIIAKLGEIQPQTSVVRGLGLNLMTGSSISATSYIGNTSGEDIYESTLASAADQQAAISPSVDTEEITLSTINESIGEIISMLRDGTATVKLTSELAMFSD